MLPRRALPRRGTAAARGGGTCDARDRLEDGACAASSDHVAPLPARDLTPEEEGVARSFLTEMFETGCTCVAPTCQTTTPPRARAPEAGAAQVTLEPSYMQCLSQAPRIKKKKQSHICIMHAAACHCS